MVTAHRKLNRQETVLEAAATCFREHGFHAASIARISKAAGMSAGHIYHYFENKEAIIRAIIERDLERMADINTRIRNAPNSVQAMLDIIEEGILENLQSDTAALKLEIFAEAARNPAVAAIVQDAERKVQGVCEELTKHLAVHRGQALDTERLSQQNTVIGMLFDGAYFRSIRSPGQPPAEIAAHVREVVHLIFTHAGLLPPTPARP